MFIRSVHLHEREAAASIATRRAVGLFVNGAPEHLAKLSGENYLSDAMKPFPNKIDSLQAFKKLFDEVDYVLTGTVVCPTFRFPFQSPPFHLDRDSASNDLHRTISTSIRISKSPAPRLIESQRNRETFRKKTQVLNSNAKLLLKNF